ncbi:NAD(P)H-dependent oxidoreductase [Streptomyces sp. H27-H1]|uniref:NADPH-dependent FMN reductase n=1 Tax=unclassified Streptomyces TaxID=2593676 RepID=UPI0022706D39|nr:MULTISPECIES: NAD(P)H-dependent oxidoreductase [unclassified Streptomyces]MCY0929238.1 NAD(P)H-dependent oxidoreductase [Streptomyces sp. H27-H1]MCY0936752.1 NAD(P)H-dependent oxidoreductase [Streptomyces sp. H34-S4]
MSEQLRVAVIIASVREGRFGPIIANWFTGVAGQRENLTIDVIDLIEHDLPNQLSQAPSDEVKAILAGVSPRLAAADAFVVVTPEYNHSFPASLKTLIDWHTTEWQAKPVGFVGYGGLAGGMRAVEQLRQIFAECHMVTVRDTVGFHGPWGQFDEQGNLIDPTQADAAAKTLLDSIEWWGTALKAKKAVGPYGG